MSNRWGVLALMAGLTVGMTFVLFGLLFQIDLARASGDFSLLGAAYIHLAAVVFAFVPPVLTVVFGFVRRLRLSKPQFFSYLGIGVVLIVLVAVIWVPVGTSAILEMEHIAQ